MFVMLGCGKVEGGPAGVTDAEAEPDDGGELVCDQPIDAYCSEQPGGCPAENSHTAMCEWLRRRGTPDLGWGGPVECTSGLKGYGVIDGPATFQYLFDGDRLALIVKVSPSPMHCFAGAYGAEMGTCEDLLVGYICPKDGGAEERFGDD
jgi:hypothetical protein